MVFYLRKKFFRFSKNYIVLLVIAALGILAVLSTKLLENTKNKVSASIHQQHWDMALFNVTSCRYEQATGALVFCLFAEDIYRTKARQHTSFKQPHITIKNQTYDSVIKVKSDTGWIDEENDIMHLTGNVTLYETGVKTALVTEVNTKSIDIDLKTKKAATQDPIEFKIGDQVLSHTIGAQIDLHEKILSSSEHKKTILVPLVKKKAKL